MSSASVTAKPPAKKKGYIIHVIIGLVIMFGFGYLPPFATITPVGMKLLGIFISVIYLWSVAGVVWPALFAIVAFGTSGYTNMAGAISSGMGNSVIFQLILLIALCGVISASGVGEFLARWAISRPAFKGKPVLFMFIFFETFCLCSLFVSSIAGIYLSWAIFYGIAEIVGYQKGEKFTTMTIIGCVFCPMLGGAVIPFKGWQLGLANAFNGATGSEINFGVFMIICLILSTIMVLLYTLAMRYVFKADFSKLKDFDTTTLDNKVSTLNTRQKCYLWSYVVIIGISLVATIAPRTSWFYKFINSTLTTAGLFAIVIGALCMIKLKDGKPILDWKNEGSKWVNWDVVFMCAVAIPVASALTSDQTGVLELFNNLLGPIFDGKSTVFLLIFVIIITVVLTNIGSNIGMGMLMIPIIAPFIASTGSNPTIIGIALIFAANMGLMLPGASALAAILFSNRDWVQPKDIYKYAAFANVMFMIVCIIGFTIFSTFVK